MKTKFTNLQKELHNLRWELQDDRIDLMKKFVCIFNETGERSDVLCDRYFESKSEIEERDFMCGDLNVLMYGLASVLMRLTNRLDRIEKKVDKLMN